ncbi:MAG: hydrolase [Lentisphaeria bacterium]|jgi:nicotinamidase-related amidase|nr:hydrolase [Lentisphaeria bacterium]MDP7741507.1 hydrolase [Lentisphaeria bacterium]
MLQPENSVVVIVDVQGKLAGMMHDHESLFENLARLIKGAQLLDLPVLWVEQNPAGLGRTVPQLAALLEPAVPFEKMSFSCCGCKAFTEAVEALGRRQILVAGIETHVCVYQTVVDLLERGYHVEVVADAVSSRSSQNREIGLARMDRAGALMTTVEMALFESAGSAEHPAFRKLVGIIK